MSIEGIPQLSCLFCGYNKPIYSKKRVGNRFELKELTIEPSEYGIITIRAVGPGPGRGHKGERGQGLNVIRRLNIGEALQDPEFSYLAEQVRDRLVQIVRSYIKAGVFDVKELV